LDTLTGTHREPALPHCRGLFAEQRRFDDAPDHQRKADELFQAIGAVACRILVTSAPNTGVKVTKIYGSQSARTTTGLGHWSPGNCRSTPPWFTGRRSALREVARSLGAEGPAIAARRLTLNHA
jgi:hypothetical protein